MVYNIGPIWGIVEPFLLPVSLLESIVYGCIPLVCGLQYRGVSPADLPDPRPCPSAGRMEVRLQDYRPVVPDIGPDQSGGAIRFPLP